MCQVLPKKNFPCTYKKTTSAFSENASWEKKGLDKPVPKN